MSHPLQPIACSLDAREASDQVAEWQELAARALASDRVEGGYAVIFSKRDAAVVEDLAQREALCCGFLSIETEKAHDRIRLLITAQDPDALPVIETLVGIPRRSTGL